MQYVKHLDNEVGTQINEISIIQDQDAIVLEGKPTIIGQFRRGRLDKPMYITAQNIRQMLGHDPLNPAYNNVLDALNSGINAIYVMRILPDQTNEYPELKNVQLYLPDHAEYNALVFASVFWDEPEYNPQQVIWSISHGKINNQGVFTANQSGEQVTVTVNIDGISTSKTIQIKESNQN